jgi:hypothetical protein
MPRYRCVKPFLLQTKVDGKAVPPTLYQIGAEVEFDGLPSSNLEPLDKAGEEMRGKAEAEFAAQRRRAVLNATDSTRAMSEAIAEQISSAIAAALGGGTIKPAKAPRAE